jgi:hypothetical protein
MLSKLSKTIANPYFQHDRQKPAHEEHQAKPGIEIMDRKSQLFIGHPERMPLQMITELQHTIGNQVVNRLLARVGIQPILIVGAAHDPYEQEAERVAERVLSMPKAPQPAVQRQEEVEEEEVQTKLFDTMISRLAQDEEQEQEEIQMAPLATLISRLIQREEAEEEEVEIQSKPLKAAISRSAEDQGEEDALQAKGTWLDSFEAGDSVEKALASSKGAGNPLPDDVRDFMEPRFGADFSGVRLHSDSQSAQLNRALSAQAFTHGQDIFLGEGKDNLTSEDGKRLLAHELTHVVQQGGILQRQPEKSADHLSLTNWNSLPKEAQGVLEYSFLTRHEDKSKNISEWIWRNHPTAAQCFEMNLSSAHKSAFINVYKALSERGYWLWVERVSEIYPGKVQGIYFMPDDREGLVSILNASSKTCHDKWPGGGMLSLSPTKWREVAPAGTPGLHFTVPSSGLCNAHIDRISPVEFRQDDGRCNYDIPIGIKHWWKEEKHIWD